MLICHSVFKLEEIQLFIVVVNTAIAYMEHRVGRLV